LGSNLRDLSSSDRPLLRVDAEDRVAHDPGHLADLLRLEVALDQGRRPARVDREVALLVVLPVLQEPRVVPADVRLGHAVVERAGKPSQDGRCVVVQHRHAAYRVGRLAELALKQHRKTGRVLHHLQAELDDLHQLFLPRRDLEERHGLAHVVHVAIGPEIPALARRERPLPVHGYDRALLDDDLAPAERPPLSIMFRTPAFTMRCGVLPCLATPLPHGMPDLRCHGITS
jgi:hypothetical protein